MNKAELRGIYIAKRRSLSLSEVAAASGRIADRFFKDIDLKRTGKLHTFVRIPKFNEIDTSNIYFRLWRERPDVATFAPRIGIETGEIESIAFDAQTPLIENNWGIREPVGNEKAEPEDFDLVLVPLLCFDLSGHRVGYGKGFYDRFLSGCRRNCRFIGLSIFGPVDLIDDANEQDVPLSACITPEETYYFSHSTDIVN